MFKLESYLTPWLLSYLDKYVKLKPEDFQLSLWGGDAVFNKLDLRLNVIENLTSIPIAFKSGVIHELRIHVPWTKLNNEPVVVTINTLEFVAKLKDVDASPSKVANNSSSFSNAKSPSSLNTSLNADTTQVQQQQQQSQAVPAGYIQNIINKVLFNICIIVNNVIVKFVEDDMVLSLSMKSAECYTVNERWEKAFVDVNLQNNQLKKILQLNDVTICLDRLENRRNSKINFYQDPFIYRFSVESRINFAYASTSNNALNPQLELIKMNFYCRKLDVSITDQQLPMLIRLIELISAIMNGTLDLPEANQYDETRNSSLTSLNESSIDKVSLGPTASVVSSSSIPLSHVSIDLEETNAKQTTINNTEESQGWLSWAWSYVPSVSLLGPEQLDQAQVDPLPSVTLRIKVGFYLDELTITFKLLNQQATNKTLNFASFLSAHAKGLCFELNQKDNISHSLFGVSHVKITSVGECCCKLCPKPKQNETLFLVAGIEDIEEKTFHYLSASLFDADENDDKAIGEVEDKEPEKSGESLTRKKERKFDDDLIKSRDKHGNLDEQYGLNRFGAIYFDVYSSLSGKFVFFSIIF
jgi:vacuolar protein sorting-associated protein 13B